MDALVVPHKTTGEVTVATVSGTVDISVEFITPMMSSIRAGTLRALAVTAGKRFAGLPEVPTVIEAGVPGYDVTSWNALAAPAKTPRPVLDKVRDALTKALADPAVQKRFADLGVEGRASSSEELRTFFLSEARRWTQVVERAGIPKQ
jgi:tripartite-type tricarboxylate transporter receptor subunit TctC